MDRNLVRVDPRSGRSAEDGCPVIALADQPHVFARAADRYGGKTSNRPSGGAPHRLCLVIEHGGWTMENRLESQLEHVVEVARRLAAEDHIDGLLQRIVDLGEEEIEACDGVSLMLIGKGGRISTPAYSSPVARDSDLAQYEAGEGPCLESLRQHQTIIIEDLEAEPRWPRYREQALQLGVRSMLSIRLFLYEDSMGVLNFYSSRPSAFDRSAELYGEVFAAHAAIALKAAIVEGGLHQALESRDVIGQAKGIVMAGKGLSSREAFARLQCVSQAQNRPLRDVAVDVVRTGQLSGE
jgi:GAF domain-containing protein